MEHELDYAFVQKVVKGEITTVRAKIDGNDYEVYDRHYKRFKAWFCHQTGLPTYGHNNYGPVADIYVSRTRIERKLEPADKVMGWYLTQNGYIPLFEAEKPPSE